MDRRERHVENSEDACLEQFAILRIDLPVAVSERFDQ